MGTLAMYAWGVRSGTLARSRSLALGTLTLSQWLQVPDWQREGEPPGSRRHDPLLLGALAASALGMPFLFHTRFFNRAFDTVPLQFGDWCSVAWSLLPPRPPHGSFTYPVSRKC